MRAVVAGACALAIASLPVPASAAADAAWVKSLEPSGWVYLDHGDTVVMFIKRAPTGDAVRRIWVRFEQFSPETDTAKSSVQLIEADCGQGRSRMIQWTAYPKKNMEGIPTSGASPTAAWEFSPPGSFGDVARKYACTDE